MKKITSPLLGITLAGMLALLVTSISVHAQITNLGSFSGTANGAFPQGSLLQIGSTLYGTTSSGGANNDGGLFSVPVSGGTPTLLDSFSGTANGANPQGDLTLSGDGSTLYGTTSSGGAAGDGNIFSVAAPAPEPGSATLLVTGVLAMALRRRRGKV